MGTTKQLKLEDLDVEGIWKKRFDADSSAIDGRLTPILEGPYLPTAVIAVLSVNLMRFMAAHTVSANAQEAENMRGALLEAFQESFGNITREIDHIAQQTGAKRPH